MRKGDLETAWCPSCGQLKRTAAVSSDGLCDQCGGRGRFRPEVRAMKWNLWVWEQPWRVIASYDTFDEAVAAGKRSADPPDTWRVAKAGSRLDEHIRQHANERHQPAVK